jgi:nucleoside-diphosphate-sugar epimerase
MSAIYVTGASGFIGQHLLTRFPKRNIITIPHKYLASIEPLKKIFENDPPDYIYHLAGFGNMAHQEDEVETVHANVNCLMNLLLASKDFNYKAFINISSSSVYGIKTHPMHETNSLESKTFYGATKIAGELLVRAFVEKYDKPIVNVRPFSVYGPGEASYRLIPTIIRCIKNNEPMPIAPGQHDWIEIEDFLDALMFIQEAAEEYKGKAINVGTGTQYDNYDVLKKLCLIGKINNPNKLPLTHINNLRSYDTWQADNSLIKSLGWMPKYSLQEGLLKVWNSMNG